MSDQPTPPQESLFLATAGQLAALALVFLLLCGTLIVPLLPPDIELDPSWQMTLAHAAAHHWQFGPDFIFTYGPLGYLLGGAYARTGFTAQVLWQLGSAAVCAGIVMAQVRRLSLPRQFLFYLFFLPIAATYADGVYAAIILLAGLALVRPPDDARLRPLLTGALFAVFSLLKFTLCLYAGFVVVAVAAYDFWRGARSRGRWLLYSYAGVFLGLWLVCGQNPLNLPAYFGNSLAVSFGYEAMQVDPTPPALALGLTALAALVAYAGLHLAGASDRRKALAQCAVLGAGTFLMWKHGFVRADGHVFGFFTFVPLAALLYPYLLDDEPKLQWARRGVLTLALLAGLAGVFVTFPKVITLGLSNFNLRWVRQVSWFAHLPAQHAALEAQWKEQAERNHLVRTPKLLEGLPVKTVDVLAHHQGIALLNQLELTSRPAFQGYTAYTPQLIRLNREFYESPLAPAVVLQRFKTIDNRLPSLDDAPLLLTLLRDYEYQFEDAGCLVWKHQPAELRNRGFTPQLAFERTVQLGERLETGELAGRNVWVTLTLEPSLLGRLRRFFYKLPVASLVTVDDTGRENRWRLVPAMAREGFLLNPLLRDQHDLLKFILGRSNSHVVSFTVDVPPELRRFFQPDLRVTVATLPPVPHVRSRVDPAVFAGNGGFRTMPLAYTAYADVGRSTIDGQSVLLLHAPSEMVFRLPAGATTVRGGFGFPPGAYEGPEHTDGAEFSIEWRAGGETKRLFHRALEPAGTPADRGLQHFELDVSGLTPGQLFFQIGPGPRGDMSYDWTCWQGIELLPVTAGTGPGEGPAASDHIFVVAGNFKSFPFSVRAYNPLCPATVGGYPMLQAHAPSELAFELPAGAKAIVGRFGYQDTAFTNGATTDGAEFSVVWTSGDEEKVLLRRYLDPVRIAADRGPQTFRLPLEGLRPGTIVLRAGVGPNNDLSWDWVCWSDIEIGDPAPLPPATPVARTPSAASAPDATQTIPASVFTQQGQFAVVPASAAAFSDIGPAMIDGKPALQVHPPSELVFPLPAGATELTAEFGFQEGAYSGEEKTEGGVFVAEWRSGGSSRELFRRALDPAHVVRDRGLQPLRAPLGDLPKGEGSIVLRIEPGESGIVSFCWGCWRGVRFDGPPAGPGPDFVPFRRTPPPSAARAKASPITAEVLQKCGFGVVPVEAVASSPPALDELYGNKVLVMQAPSQMVVPFKAGARRLTGSFGIQEGAYSGDNPTDGADVIILWRAGGQVRELFRRTLFPATVLDDRGLLPLSLDVSGLEDGELVFRTGTGPSGNKASDWTCWQGLTLK